MRYNWSGYNWTSYYLNSSPGHWPYPHLSSLYPDLLNIEGWPRRIFFPSPRKPWILCKGIVMKKSRSRDFSARMPLRWYRSCWSVRQWSSILFLNPRQWLLVLKVSPRPSQIPYRRVSSCHRSIQNLRCRESLQSGCCIVPQSIEHRMIQMQSKQTAFRKNG